MDRKKKILLVEDDFLIRDLYLRILTKAGYEVLLAEDGQDCLKEAKKKPDLILLDIMMPKLNGIETLKILKSDDNVSGIPVVLLTNLGQASIIKKAFEDGAQGYLLKMKTDPKQLIACVNDYLVDPTLKMSLEGLDLD